MQRGKFELLLAWAGTEAARTGGLNQLASLVFELLGEAQRCGVIAPVVANGGVQIPAEWTTAHAHSPDETRAMARMLLVAADEAEKK